MHGWIDARWIDWFREGLYIQVNYKPSVIVVFQGKHKVLRLDRWVFVNLLDLLVDWSKPHLEKVSVILN